VQNLSLVLDRYEHYIDYLSMKIVLNKKYLSWKVAYIIEIYIFFWKKLIFIRVYIKLLRFFKDVLEGTV
jgi:hypothetical protein